MAEYIEREKVLDSLRELSAGLKDILNGLKYIEEIQICNAEISTVYECAMRVTEQPTADVVPVLKGHWEERRFIVFDNEIVGYKCSECNTTWDTPTPYCPNCGAKMDGERRCD